ncbi:hypothetical protein PMAYCL1PPCAC_21695 [Pristionchus mayeri]|uniref:SXP/RAL-2 family protein Ani s 5-like cation-binding domain-containing protein n=1 Tax=Pristionchus mayeri TaxID=1317129 RepID=A0AAN5CVY9_9BILA|nr:hypothetical protein PMAYCL1PPCAC_21695 [Pristionchus mayeri]
MARVLLIISSLSLLVSAFPFGFWEKSVKDNDVSIEDGNSLLDPITGNGGGEAVAVTSMPFVGSFNGAFNGGDSIHSGEHSGDPIGLPFIGGDSFHFGGEQGPIALPTMPIKDGDSSEGTSILGELSFFFKLPKEAKIAFVNILKNSTSTKAEIKTAISEWAAEYNITSEVTSLIEKKKELKSKFRADIAQAMSELPAAVQKFDEIADDDSMTLKETFEKTRETISGLTTPYLKALAMQVLTLGALFQ